MIAARAPRRRTSRRSLSKVARLTAATATIMLGATDTVQAQSQPRANPPLPLVVDFDAAMKGLGFAPNTTDANLDVTSKPNGMLDADELALVSAILANPTFDRSASRGVTHALVRAAFLQARASATTDMQSLASRYPTAADVSAGYAMLGKGSFAAYNEMSGTFGAPLKSDYTLAVALSKYLAYDGDADGDGVSNRDEYLASISGGRAAYLKAALDPAIKTVATSASAATPAVSPPGASTKKTVGIVLYPGFEVLDVFGPIEMWSYVTEFKVVLVAEKAGPVKSAQGVSTIAEYSFANAPPLDVMMVPGGVGTFTELKNAAFLDYLRTQHARTELTTSVCTGSALLAKAGILAGHKATSNKAYFALAMEQDPSVQWMPKARWVDDGKLLTSSGVSAGTDMALGMVAKLYGKDRARLLAKSLEYEWHEDPNADPFALTVLPTVKKK